MAILIASVNAEAFLGHGSHGHGHDHSHDHSHSHDKSRALVRAGATGAPDKSLDPHKNICWDVSTYSEVKYKNEPCEKCHPRLEKVPDPQSTKVSNVY